MTDARRLRDRISLLLFAAGMVGAAHLSGCGGKVAVDGNNGSGAGGALSTTSSSSGGEVMCPGGGTPSMECHLPAPGGTAPDDCEPASQVTNSCCNTADFGPIAQDGECCYFFCETACCGRAFTVAGKARVAGVTAREGWSRAVLAQIPIDLDEATRAALIEAWSIDAQMEHASVASFARFTLELLSLGAPADLVAASQQASLDEVEHARLAFDMASRFAGRALGPAPLDVDGSLTPANLAIAAARAVREGAVGETIAALTARAQLARAEDEAARAALARVAEDEEAHAAFAWRFVAWAMATGGEQVSAAVHHSFQAAICSARAARAPATPHVDIEAWHRYGRLTAAEIDAVTAAALDEVIEPCAGALTAPRAAEAVTLSV